MKHLTKKDVPPTLLPCPFCGSTNVAYEEGSWHAVRCDDCPAYVEAHKSEATREEIEAAWNRRAALATRSTPCCIDAVAHAVREPSDGRALYIRRDEHGRREKLADDYYPPTRSEEPLREIARLRERLRHMCPSNEFHGRVMEREECCPQCDMTREEYQRELYPYAVEPSVPLKQGEFYTPCDVWSLVFNSFSAGIAWGVKHPNPTDDELIDACDAHAGKIAPHEVCDSGEPFKTASARTSEPAVPVAPDEARKDWNKMLSPPRAPLTPIKVQFVKLPPRKPPDLAAEEPMMEEPDGEIEEMLIAQVATLQSRLRAAREQAKEDARTIEQLTRSVHVVKDADIRSLREHIAAKDSEIAELSAIVTVAREVVEHRDDPLQLLDLFGLCGGYRCTACGHSWFG